MARKLALLSVCAIALVSFLLLDASFFTSLSSETDSLSVTEIQVTQCSLHEGVCDVPVNDVPISFALTPKHIPPLEPLSLSISFSDSIHAADMLIWFEGRDMEMGRHFFSADSILSEGAMGKSKQVFRGMIPVCTIDQQMIWQLHVQFSIDRQRYDIVFDLQPNKHAN